MVYSLTEEQRQAIRTLQPVPSDKVEGFIRYLEWHLQESAVPESPSECSKHMARIVRTARDLANLLDDPLAKWVNELSHLAIDDRFKRIQQPGKSDAECDCRTVVVDGNEAKDAVNIIASVASELANGSEKSYGKSIDAPRLAVLLRALDEHPHMKRGKFYPLLSILLGKSEEESTRKAVQRFRRRARGDN